MEIQPENYSSLVTDIGQLLLLGRQKATTEVNTILLRTYWEIGKYIVEFEQKGNLKAEYGTQLLERLSRDLSIAFGKGFSRSNLFYMIKLYRFFSNSETLSHKCFTK